MLSELCKMEHCHCLCLHETHISTDYTRPNISGMTLVAKSPHPKIIWKHCIILKYMNLNSISVRKHGNVELLTGEMSGVVIHFVYKRPNDRIVQP